jgi:hypothetical protein
LFATALFALAGPLAGIAQPVTAPWGNVTGILVEGERMAFESSLRAVDPDWKGFVQSSKYNWEGHQVFKVDGPTYTCAHNVQSTQLQYKTTVTDTGKGTAEVTLDVSLDGALSMAGAYYCFDLPASDYLGSRFELLGADRQPIQALADQSASGKEILRIKARGFRATSEKRSIEVLADADAEFILRQDFVDQPAYLNDAHPRLQFRKEDPRQKVADFQCYFEVLPKGAEVGSKAARVYRIEVGGSIDREAVSASLDAGSPGRAFAGISGNFRMQYPELDPQVVDYCLDNLNVTWGRVAFPWNEWQPEASGDLREKVLAGEMSPFFYRQLEMSKRLAREGIPVIIAIWNPPSWAVDQARKLPKGVKLRADKMQEIADSIANWIEFIKKYHGVEVALFSFNEPDYGVEVHHSPEEHAVVNKVIGSTFAARGLVTKMMIGDTGACTVASSKMVDPTLADPSIAPYIGAIAFHTYHGVTQPDLEAWAEKAKRSNLPLLVTETGPDSAAHRYPLIFTTPWFAQLEIDDYLRICATCQPNTLMPWQLNADYSPIAGGGIYGDHGPLRPAQRFWSLKQLGSLCPGSFWLPLSIDRPGISGAALGDLSRGQYALHFTNNGASRTTTVSGIPASVKTMKVYVTDANRGMQLMAEKGVVDGKVSFLLEAQTFTSLISESSQ